MLRHSKNIKLLEKINNIDEDCFEDDQEIPDIEGETKRNNYDLVDNDQLTPIATREHFEQRTKRREQKRMRFIVRNIENLVLELFEIGSVIFILYTPIMMDDSESYWNLN